MQIETIEIHNFKVFHNVELKELDSLAVFLGENAAGNVISTTGNRTAVGD